MAKWWNRNDTSDVHVPLVLNLDHVSTLNCHQLKNSTSTSHQNMKPIHIRNWSFGGAARGDDRGDTSVLDSRQRLVLVEVGGARARRRTQASAKAADSRA